LSSAGDVLLTSPLLKLMREREPDSEIHFVVKSQFADLVRSNPNVNRLHIVQDRSDFHQLESVRRVLMGEKFDETLDLHRNFRSIYLRRETAPVIHVIRKDAVRRAILVDTKLNLFTNVRSAALKYAQTYDETIASVPVPELYFPADVGERMDRIWGSIGGGNDGAVFLCPGQDISRSDGRSSIGKACIQNIGFPPCGAPRRRTRHADVQSNSDRNVCP